jgi:hypothetical protein
MYVALSGRALGPVTFLLYLHSGFRNIPYRWRTRHPQVVVVIGQFLPHAHIILLLQASKACLRTRDDRVYFTSTWDPMKSYRVDDCKHRRIPRLSGDEVRRSARPWPRQLRDHRRSSKRQEQRWDLGLRHFVVNAIWSISRSGVKPCLAYTSFTPS